METAPTADGAAGPAGSAPLNTRVGIGYDVHRLVPGRRLVLGGVEFESEVGLEGHSDADVALHALCDALLGAAAAGDMGQHFPSDDARWRDAPSLVFLERVVEVVAERGFAIGNVDLTVIAERPRLSAHAGAMREALGRALRQPAEAVSVKLKSADGLGALGAGEGIAAQAAVILKARRA
jgi:2-C-methyl-D-erythritol 2,4-cyclodiphosphate synthase